MRPGAVAAEALLLQPMLWILMIKFGNSAEMLVGHNMHVALSGQAASILLQARPDEVRENAGRHASALPEELWSELSGAGLLRADAPTPAHVPT